MVIKVKEPLESEYPYSKEGLVLFTYLHLANEEKLTQALIDRKVISIAYETVQLPDRSLPLLSPMSEVAGRMSAQVGAEFLQKLNGGMGILLGGVPGVPKGKVTIIGGGQAGTNAAKIALGLGADVTILDVNPKRLQQLDDLFGGRVHTIMSNPLNIELYVKQSDLVIGAVLIPGAKAPRLVTEDMIKQMKKWVSLLLTLLLIKAVFLKQLIKLRHMIILHISNMVWFIMQLQICGCSTAYFDVSFK